MKFSAHSIRLAPPERAIRVILLAILRSATVPTSMPFQWGEYISDPGDVCSMCEGMPIQGIRCETQVIGDLKRTSNLPFTNMSFILVQNRFFPNISYLPSLYLLKGEY